MIPTLLLGFGVYLSWGLLGSWAQDPGTKFSHLNRPGMPEGWRLGAEDTSRDPIRRYRVAQKPVYQVQQKVLISVDWRCCPGFQGPDCQDHNPTANPEPTEPSGKLQETWDSMDGFELGHPVPEFNEIKVPQEQQENLLQNLQNDAQSVEDGFPGSWEAPPNNLFQNFQGLVASNISLDLGKLQAMLSKKDKKQPRGPGESRKRDKKQVVMSTDAHAKGLELWETGSPVAFYAGSSEGATALQMVKFNTTSINVGSSYFPEHGYFRAPKRGVYLFAVSITFGPGPGMGQLVFEGHHRVPVYSTEQRGGSTATTFAMVELQKGERAWFELIQGSATKGSQPGTAFGGFLMFKT